MIGKGKAGAFAAGCLGLIVFVSLCASWISPYDPNQIDMSNRLMPLSAAHWMGTDQLGRDVYSRILYGGRVSLLLSGVATVSTLFVGFCIGVLGGYFRGKVDTCLQTIVHIFQGVPGLTMMLAIVGVLGPSLKSLFLAIVLTSWADFSRVVRGEVMKVQVEPYIEGARVLGASTFYIMIVHIIPSIAGTVLVLLTIRMSRTLLMIASLSFLGLGVQPPTPDWSVMLNDARPFLRTQPHLMLVPGICIAAVSLSFQIIGDTLRDRLDPKRMQRVEDIA